MTDYLALANQDLLDFLRKQNFLAPDLKPLTEENQRVKEGNLLALDLKQLTEENKILKEENKKQWKEIQNLQKIISQKDFEISLLQSELRGYKSEETSDLAEELDKILKGICNQAS